MAKPNQTYRPDWSLDPEISDLLKDFSPADFAMAEEISKSVNLRIDGMVPPPPATAKYVPHFLYGLVLLSGIAFYFLWQDEKQLADSGSASSPGENKNTTIVQAPSSTSDHTVQKVDESGTFPANENGTKQVLAPEITDNNTKNENDLAESLTEYKTDNLENSLGTETNTTKDNKEKNQEIIPVDNTKKQAEDNNRFVYLRIANVQVMNKVDLASSTGSGNKTTKVNDPNIGGKTITKTKNNTYALDDMPQHTGGDQGLISYISRNLSNRIYIRKSTAVNTVNVRFEVNSKGKVENVSMLDDIPGPMEKEIISVLENDNGWSPGKKSGKKGSLEIILSIQFYW